MPINRHYPWSNSISITEELTLKTAAYNSCYLKKINEGIFFNTVSNFQIRFSSMVTYPTLGTTDHLPAESIASPAGAEQSGSRREALGLASRIGPRKKDPRSQECWNQRVCLPACLPALPAWLCRKAEEKRAQDRNL